MFFSGNNISHYLHSKQLLESNSSTHTCNDDKTQIGGGKIRKVLRRLSLRSNGGTDKSYHNHPENKANKILVTPQKFLDKLLQERGYSTVRYESLESGYSNKATSYQKACYGIEMKRIIDNSDIEALKAMLDVGISSNPYDDDSGTYFIHKVCQKGDLSMVQVLIEYGGSRIVQVVDAFGRTPLHDACIYMRQSPSFDLLTSILECDPQLLYLTDCRKAEPLSYVKEEQYQYWIQYFEFNKDKFWPIKSNISTLDEMYKLSTEKPNSKRFPKPKKALTLELAQMLSSGCMIPDEVRLLQYNCNEFTNAYKENGKDELTDEESCDFHLFQYEGKNKKRNSDCGSSIDDLQSFWDDGEILNTCEEEDNTETGWTTHSNSNFLNDSDDCIFSLQEILEISNQVMEKRSRLKSKKDNTA